MVVTTWIGGSGDWNTAADWSNGVPTAADDAVFAHSVSGYGTDTVTGNGPAASLSILAPGGDQSFAGTHAVGAFVDENYGRLLGGGAIGFGAATISGGGQLDVRAGAGFGSGPLTLDFGLLTLQSVVLSSPITLVSSGSVAGKTGTLAGLISGTGELHLGDDVVLANPGNIYSGGTAIGMGDVYGPDRSDLGHVEIGAGTAAGSGPIGLGSGTLTLDPGAIVGPISAAFGRFDPAEIDASDQSATVFVGRKGLVYNNGSGHPTIVGASGPGPGPGYGYGDGQPSIFGSMTIQGGTGSITVFGGDEGGVFHGGSAGNNLLFGGADLTGFPPVEDGGYLQDGSAYSPGPVTMFGGGDGDFLVAGGTDNSYASAASKANVLVAAGGRETLTGSGSTGRNVFFGGSGADVIAAGAGASTVIAGIGIATISGGAGAAAIFAGAGSAVVLGGGGADYVQAGAGNATLFAGAGMDIVGVVSGQAGGSLVVSGFRAGIDRVSAQGYAAGPVVASGGGSTVLTFSDQTRVTLLGVASLPGGVAS
ncbi:MAG: hypothetical protein ACRYG6_08430 [Janthinobacterium lividum]